MPRAKKPSTLDEIDSETGYELIEPQDIDSVNFKAAIDILKINDSDKREKCAFELHFYLRIHPYAEFDTKTTAGQFLARLLPIKRKTDDLLAELQDLDYHSEDIISMCGLGTSGEMMLESFSENLSKWIESLKIEKRQGKPRDEALRFTMQNLAGVYVDYRNPSSEDWHEFISYALSAANIVHPDFNDNPSRFEGLLQPEALKELRSVP